ncbi:MAG: TMEM175 family protein [Chitinophagales bacterium]
MTKTRLEAFSDGVIAIIITIMVLELKIPHEATLKALWDLGPVFISYVLSFVYVGIYWGNHHHLLHTAHRVSSKLIWSNMTLLFFLSLIPFTTGWMGENHFDKIPVATYAFNLLCCAIAFFILQLTIQPDLKQSTKLTEALKKQEKKGIISLLIYFISIPCALYFPLISALLFALTAIMWVIPDKNIERTLKDAD